MIKLIEIDTIKCPGVSSFTIEMGYNPSLFKQIISVSNVLYHKKLSKLEIPISAIAEILDLLTQYDDV